MKKIYPDLWQLSREKMFGMDAHGYLLIQDHVNALFYNPHGSSDFSRITEMGGLKYNYLSHSHEINSHLQAVKKQFGSQLCCHENVKPYFNDSFAADLYFDSSSTQLHVDGIEVIYTPGHTNNNLCFRYCSPHGKTYLFTGDTIYQDKGTWNTLIVASDGGNKDDLERSLLQLRELDVDVIICNVSIGKIIISEVEKSEWQTIIDNLIDH